MPYLYRTLCVKYHYFTGFLLDFFTKTTNSTVKNSSLRLIYYYHSSVLRKAGGSGDVRYPNVRNRIVVEGVIHLL